MSKLAWDLTGERLYETGVDRGVLYPQVGGAYPKGEAWNGLINVTEKPSGAEPSPVYADNIKYLNLMSNEEFGATIEAYMYPDGFAACNGESEVATGVFIAQQKRSQFGLSYRTLIGNDTEGTDYGYKLHLVWGGLASPSEKANASVNENVEPGTMSWEVTTTPVAVDDKHKPTAHMYIDSTKVDAEKLAALEAILYGSETEEARLPLPGEVIELVGVAAAG